MSEPLCSVVIPCYRNPTGLRRCLAGLTPLRQGEGFEVVVVDSGPDNTISLVVHSMPSARCISQAERLWPARARNFGARQARGELLFFTDADCVPEPGWIRAGVSALGAGARVVSGPVLDLYPNHLVAASDNLLQFSECAVGRPAGPAVRFPSCNFAIRRTDFDALGGFPEQLQSGEDTVLSSRARAAWPQSLRYVPDMQVRHEGRERLRGFLEHQAWFGHSRGMLANDLTPLQQGLAAHAIVLPAIVLKRLCYILGRSVSWNPRGVPRALLLSPLLVAGLSAYGIGLRRGLRGGAAPAEPW